MLTTLILAACLGGTSFGASNSYFEDFNDGIADGWQVVHGDWEVVFGVYRGIGRTQPNSVHNISHVPATSASNYSVEAVMSTDTGFDDVNKMLVLRYNDPANFYFVNFVAGSRHFVVVERVLGGVRTLITPEFTYNIPEHGQADWKRVRADIIGNRVIAYFEGVAVCDVPLPTIVIPSGSAGINTFSSGGGDEESYIDEFACRPAEFGTPLTLEKIFGGASTGGLQQVANADNLYYQVSPRYDTARNQPNIELVWTGQATITTIREATVRYEGYATSGGSQQVLELWDWIDSNWDQADSRPTPTTDTAIRIPIANLARHLSSTGAVKVRARYFAGGSGARFDVKVDEFNLHVVSQ